MLYCHESKWNLHRTTRRWGLAVQTLVEASFDYRQHTMSPIAWHEKEVILQSPLWEHSDKALGLLVKKHPTWFLRTSVVQGPHWLLGSWTLTNTLTENYTHQVPQTLFVPRQSHPHFGKLRICGLDIKRELQRKTLFWQNLPSLLILDHKS